MVTINSGKHPWNIESIMTLRVRVMPRKARPPAAGHKAHVYLIDLEYQECIAGIINMAIFEVSNLKLKCTYGNIEACPL